MKFRTCAEIVAVGAVALACGGEWPDRITLHEDSFPGECFDGSDNDLDGQLDCDDRDCARDTSCTRISVPLTSPWTETDVPIGDGWVVACDPHSLWVNHDGNVSEVAAPYEAWLAAEGWTETSRKTDNLSVSTTWSRDGKVLAMLVMRLKRDATVSISTY